MVKFDEIDVVTVEWNYVVRFAGVVPVVDSGGFGDDGHVGTLSLPGFPVSLVYSSP